MRCGREVYRCKPFAHVVNQGYLPTVCDFCMRTVADEKSTFKKRTGCKLIHYCQVSCQKKAWLAYHRHECQYLRKVTPKIPTDTVRLMARVILRLRQGAMRDHATLPDGTQRYFEDLMSHQKEIVRDAQRIEAFQ